MAQRKIEALDPVAEELIGIAAAVASQCECCFSAHYNEALELGVPFRQIEEAVALAQEVAERHRKHVEECFHRRMGEAVAQAGS